MSGITGENRGRWPGDAPKRFPSGVTSFLTEDERIGSKLEELARRLGVFRSRDGGVVAIEIPDGQEDDSCLAFGTSLSPLEQERTLVLRNGAAGPRLLSLRRLLARCQEAWFLDFLRYGVCTAFLQPIADLTSGVVWGYETVLRASEQNGTKVDSERAFRSARATGFVAHLDAKARRAAIEASRRHLERTDRLFIKLEAESLFEGLGDFELTLPLARALPQSPDHIVFEVTGAESVDESRALVAALAPLREEGFRIGLDRLASGFAVIATLETLRPDFVKLDRRLVSGAHGDRYRCHLVTALVELARDMSIPLIAPGVETADDYFFVRDLGVPLAQGSLLGGPETTAVRDLPLLRRLEPATGAP